MFLKSSLMNGERKQRSMLCQAGELYNAGEARGISRDVTFSILRPGFVFRLRVVFAFLARRNFKVKKLFVGVIFPRKLTTPHSHGIQEECCDHIRNLTPFSTPRATPCFGIVYASHYPCKISLWVVLQPHSWYKSGEQLTIHETNDRDSYCIFSVIFAEVCISISFFRVRPNGCTHSRLLHPNWDLCVPGRKDVLCIEHWPLPHTRCNTLTVDY